MWGLADYAWRHFFPPEVCRYFQFTAKSTLKVEVDALVFGTRESTGPAHGDQPGYSMPRNESRNVTHDDFLRWARELTKFVDQMVLIDEMHYTESNDVSINDISVPALILMSNQRLQWQNMGVPPMFDLDAMLGDTRELYMRLEPVFASSSRQVLQSRGAGTVHTLSLIHI